MEARFSKLPHFFNEADKRAAGKLNFKHELVPVRINDPLELSLPDAGRVYLRDPESGNLLEADLGNRAVREAHAQAVQAQRVKWKNVFNQLGVDMLDLTTTQDFIPPLRSLFSRRSRLIVH